MADLSKLMKKRLGVPPPLEDASANLQAPEVAPEAPAAAAPEPAPQASSRAPAKKRLDGRSLRATGRTVQFATRISAKLDDDIREIAKNERWLLAEVIEKAIESLKKELPGR